LLAAFTLLGSIWFLALYLQNIAGYGPVAAGVRTLPLTVTTLIVAPMAGKIATRRGPVPVLAVGLVVTAAAFAALARVNTGTGYGYLAAALLALGAGLALVLPTAVAVMLDGVAPDRAGVAAGLATMSRQAGGALGLAVLATIGARLAVSDFHDLLPASPDLDDLVSGGRVQLIGRLAGQSARDAATAGFLHGFSTVMEAAAAVTLLALAAALRTGRNHHMRRPSDVAASHPTTAAPPDAVPARRR
jgi:Na+/melibiose symporter-like transporter